MHVRPLFSRKLSMVHQYRHHARQKSAPHSGLTIFIGKMLGLQPEIVKRIPGLPKEGRHS